MENELTPASPVLWLLAGSIAVVVLLAAMSLRRFRAGRTKEGSQPAVSQEPPDDDRARSGGTSSGGIHEDDHGDTAQGRENRRSIDKDQGPSETELLASLEAVDPTDAREGDNELRLELAQVYIELGDTRGSRRLLDLVIEEGDEEQRESARNLLNQTIGNEESSVGGSHDGIARLDGASGLEAENLLDLATAYVEIGDGESARKLIARVESSGNEEQRRQAALLKGRLE
jgi:FimV-like protein